MKHNRQKAKKPIIKLLEGGIDGRKVLTIYVGRQKSANAGSTRDLEEALVLIARWVQEQIKGMSRNES